MARKSMKRFESWSYVPKMRRITNNASNFILYFLKATNRIFRKAIREAITKK